MIVAVETSTGKVAVRTSVVVILPVLTGVIARL